MLVLDIKHTLNKSPIMMKKCKMYIVQLPVSWHSIINSLVLAQGVDVSRVLSHFSALSHSTSPRDPRVPSKPLYAKAKHVTLFEANDGDSSEETDPLSSSESSYAESDRSFRTTSFVYSNNNNNNIAVSSNNNNMKTNQKDIDDEPDALKRDHVFVKFAESQVMKEVIQLFSDLKSELGLENQLSTFSNHFHALRRELAGKVPDRLGKFYSVLGFDS